MLVFITPEICLAALQMSSFGFHVLLNLFMYFHLQFFYNLYLYKMYIYMENIFQDEMKHFDLLTVIDTICFELLLYPYSLYGYNPV